MALPPQQLALFGRAGHYTRTWRLGQSFRVNFQWFYIRFTICGKFYLSTLQYVVGCCGQIKDKKTREKYVKIS